MPRTNHSNVTEVASLRTDLKKYHENFDSIDWGKKAEPDAEGSRMATKEELDQLKNHASESSPYMAEGMHDRAYTEGFTDAGTRMATKAEMLEIKLVHAIKALEFYENTTRLMINVRDIATEDTFGMPMAYDSVSIMDNGDTAREALAKIKEPLFKGA